MSTLTGKSIANSYKDLLQISNSNIGVDNTIRYIEDGEGTISVLGISTSVVQTAGDILPDVSISRDIGSTSKRFRTMYLGDKLYIGSTPLTEEGIQSILDFQNANFASVEQGALADTALQPGDFINFNFITNTPTTLAGYGITDGATAAQGALADTALQPGDTLDFTTDITNTPTTLTGYGITDAATSTQGSLADTALQPGAVDFITDIVSKPETLAGYGITDAATSAQGDKADTALQPATVDFDFDIINKPQTLVGYGIIDAASILQGNLADTALQPGDVAFADLTSKPTTLAGYGITDAATATQGALADSSLQPGSPIAFGTIYNKPNTLAGYGITDAATAAQGSLAETALQPEDAVTASWDNLDGKPTTVAGFGIEDAATKTYVDDAVIASQSQSDWANITNTPTTLVGYGITDAASSSQGDRADTALQPGDAATNAQGAKADTALQPGEAATPTQGVLADTALQPGDFINFNFITDTPTTLSGYGITDAATAAQGELASTAYQPGGDLQFSWILNTPTTLAGYGITDAATAAQGALADTALQPGDVMEQDLSWTSITDTPTTLSGYGITDAATAAQGALADTALQPGETGFLYNINLSGGYIYGPDTMYIDPETIGSRAGKLVVLGDLQVEGTTTTVNSEIIAVSGKILELAQGSTTPGEADSAGVVIDGANATMLYSSVNDSMVFNKSIDVQDLKINGQDAVFSNWSVVGSDIYRDTGNVGIGNTTPAYRLDVAQASGDAINIDAGNDFSGLRLSSDSGAWSLRTSTSDNLFVYDVENSSQVFTFARSGFIGIGTDIPESKLHVNSGIFPRTASFDTTAGGGYLQFNNSGNTFGYFQWGMDFAGAVGGDNMLITNANTTGGVAIQTGAGSNGTNTRLFVSEIGNIGIGTTNPGSKVEINAGTNDSALHIKSSDSYVDLKLSDSTTTDDGLRIAGYGDHLLLQRAGGCVGIGVIPQTKLDIKTSDNTVYDPTDRLQLNDATLRIYNYDEAVNSFSQIVLGNRNTGASMARIAAVSTGSGDCDLSIGVSGTTVNSEALRITSEGNVAIGTSDLTNNKFTVMLNETETTQNYITTQFVSDTTKAASGLTIYAGSNTTTELEQTAFLRFETRDPSLNGTHGAGAVMAFSNPEDQGVYGTGQIDFYLRNGSPYIPTNWPGFDELTQYYMPSIFTIKSDGRLGGGTSEPRGALDLRNNTHHWMSFGYKEAGTGHHQLKWDSSKVFLCSDSENTTGGSGIGLVVDGVEGYWQAPGGNTRIGGDGTGDPPEKLQVVGAINLTSVTGPESTTGGTIWYNSALGAAGAFAYKDSAGVTRALDGSLTYSYSGTVWQSGSQAGDIHYSLGAVGIGEANPNFALTIGSIETADSMNYGMALGLQAPAGETAVGMRHKVGNNYVQTVLDSDYTFSWKFYESSPTAYTTYLKIDNNTHLTSGDGKQAAAVILEGANANVASRVQFNHNGGGGRTGVDGSWHLAYGSNETRFNTGVTQSTSFGGLSFYFLDDVTGYYDCMRLTPTGNLVVADSIAVGTGINHQATLHTISSDPQHALFESHSNTEPVRVIMKRRDSTGGNTPDGGTRLGTLYWQGVTTSEWDGAILDAETTTTGSTDTRLKMSVNDGTDAKNVLTLESFGVIVGTDLMPSSNMVHNIGSESTHWNVIHSHNYWVHDKINFAPAAANISIAATDVQDWNSTTTTVAANSGSWGAGGTGGSSTLNGLTDVDTTGVSDGDTLVYDAATQAWSPGAGGSTTGNFTRTTATVVTTSIGDNVSVDTDVAVAKSYMLMKIETSHAAWVTIYSDSVSRTNDATRNETTDPVVGSGVLAEVITTGNVSQLITPGVYGFNNDATINDKMYLKIVNKTGVASPTPITVTITYLPLES